MGGGERKFQKIMLGRGTSYPRDTGGQKVIEEQKIRCFWGILPTIKERKLGISIIIRQKRAGEIKRNNPETPNPIWKIQKLLKGKMPPCRVNQGKKKRTITNG